ncbi:MAG TPA: peptidylprolyl isomerase [Lacipirellulaceae bacterium]|nr:peptidylprolyl isomerase [Lacipirellulaceae bacterium]
MLRWRTAIWTSAAIAALATASDRASATVVRFVTNLGNIDVRLYDSATPLTVANFLNYVTSDRYDGTFIHRAPDLNVGTQQNPIFEPFVVQGGGYKLAAPPVGIFGAAHIPTFSPVLNEPGLTNARGTIAMAKLGGDPNSATSEWFFNMRNNAGGGPALDTQNGGFTVFGRVVGPPVIITATAKSTPRIWPFCGPTSVRRPKSMPTATATAASTAAISSFGSARWDKTSACRRPAPSRSLRPASWLPRQGCWRCCGAGPRAGQRRADASSHPAPLLG